MPTAAPTPPIPLLRRATAVAPWAMCTTGLIPGMVAPNRPITAGTAPTPWPLPWGGMVSSVAPGASWFSCVNLARNLGHVAYYLDCMQFMLAPILRTATRCGDGRPDLAADVSTNSWGCPSVLEGVRSADTVAGHGSIAGGGDFLCRRGGQRRPGL